MRCHVRRLLTIALSAACVSVALVNVLQQQQQQSATGDRERQLRLAGLADVELQPQARPQSLDQQLAKYRQRPDSEFSQPAAAAAAETVGQQETVKHSTSLVGLKPQIKLNFNTTRQRLDRVVTKPQHFHGELTASDGGTTSSEGVDNERVRQQYVRVEPPPPPSAGVPTRSLWFPDVRRHPDDRILTQMRHVPDNYRADDPTQPLKTIYIPSGIGSEPLGQMKFLIEKCPVSSCRLSTDHKDAVTADLRLLLHDASFYSAVKPPGQIWVMYVIESPANTGRYINSRDLINWTATYRWDSTIVTPYEKFVPYATAATTPLLKDRSRRRKNNRSVAQASSSASVVTEPDHDAVVQRNYAAGKTKLVAWFVSNCGARNARRQYAAELARYIQVDVFGACGTNRCARTDDHCRQMLNNDYKFYLSFENSNCDYYITEKLFDNGLRNDIVPIVMGGRRVDYEHAAPPHSYIHVEDYATAQDLAKYLYRLDQSDDLYNEYFAWKSSGEFINTKFWCRLCALLHDDRKPHMWYSDFDAWWSHRGACRSDRWEGRSLQYDSSGNVTHWRGQIVNE